MCSFFYKRFICLLILCMSVLPACMRVHYGSAWCCRSSEKEIGSLELEWLVVVTQCSIAVKRCHEQGNCYRWKHLTGGLQLQTLSPLSLWWGAWPYRGRCGAEVAESYILICKQKETLGLEWKAQDKGALKPQGPSPEIHFLQQVHLSLLLK